MKRETFKYTILAMVVATVGFYVLGFLEMIFEKNFAYFHWPYDGDISKSIYQLRIGLKPDVEPLNRNTFTFIHNAENVCRSHDQQIQLIFIIKSDPKHFNRRSTIRSSWGYSDKQIKAVFLLGQREDPKLQESIEEEASRYSDIVQTNFTDTYFNNTLKTLSGFRWAVKHCSGARFFMFVDDDYYVSTKNVLRFLKYPTEYPNNRSNNAHHQNILKLFAGYVFHKSRPKRSLINKWYISLMQYPFNKYPSYVTAGAYILSREALIDIYYTSFYVKNFIFDDIYLGILALRANIDMFHCDEFYYDKKYYTRDSYKFTIASHGYSDPHELLLKWREQKYLGNA